MSHNPPAYLSNSSLKSDSVPTYLSNTNQQQQPSYLSSSSTIQNSNCKPQFAQQSPNIYSQQMSSSPSTYINQNTKNNQGQYNTKMNHHVTPNYLQNHNTASQTYNKPQQTNINSPSLPNYLQFNEPVQTSVPTLQCTPSYLQQRNDILNDFGVKIDPNTQNNNKLTVNPDDLPAMMLMVQQDPRYRRLLFKYAPPKTNSKGLVQYAKNKVDPSHLPVFGLFVNSFRTMKMTEHTKLYKDTGNTVTVNENITEDVQGAMEVGLEAQLAKQSVKTGLDIAFSWIPIIRLIPFGSCLKIVGYKGAEKVAGSRNPAEGLEGKTLHDYKRTKAFLLYLGYPETKETLYQKWEPTRILLKEFFGSSKEEDLYTMMGEWKQYEKEQEKAKKTPSGVPVEHPEAVSLLLILWRVYDCWDIPYYKRISKIKDGIDKNIFKKDVLSDNDEMFFDDLKNLGYNPNYDFDSHVILASIEYLDGIVQVLTSSFLRNNRFDYITSDFPDPKERALKIGGMMRIITKYFLENYQVWIYIEHLQDKKQVVRAAALWETPRNDMSALPFGKIMRYKIGKHIGASANRKFKLAQTRAVTLKKYHYNQFECDTSTLHFFGFWQDPQNPLKYKYCQTILLFNLIESTPPCVPTYAIITKDQEWDLKEIGFYELTGISSNKQINSIHGFLYVKSE